MTKVFHRRPQKRMATAVSGAGVRLIDRDGKRYLDASAGGAGMLSLGYSHPRVVEALNAQSAQLAFIHGAIFTTEPLEALAEELVAQAPEGLDRMFFVSGGTEGIESALMMARQYAVEIGQTGRHRIIARKNSYHGSSLASFSVGDAHGRKAPFAPMLSETAKISASYPYRHQRSDETEEQYGLRIADELEAAILEAGPETVLAFIVETVGGTSSGALPVMPGYFERVRAICDRYGVLLILDEVFAGMGRVGSLYACSSFGVVPDFLVVAKGLAAGFVPMGAVLTSNAIHDAISEGTGYFQAGFTNSGHTLACAAGLAVQRVFREDGILDNVNRQGERLRAGLEERFGNHPHVGDIRGHGLARAIELVVDRASKSPFDASAGLAGRVAAESTARGFICLPAGGTIDGRSGEHVMLAPPLIISDADVDEMVDKLGAAVDAATRSILG